MNRHTGLHDAIERVTIQEAARRLGKSEKTVRRWVHHEKLHPVLIEGKFLFDVNELKALAEAEKPGPSLEERMTALEERMTAWERKLEALNSSLGTKPRTSSVVPQKTEGPGTALPEGLVSWRAYAKERGIPETTAQRAIDAGKIAVERGRWKAGHAVITQALTEEGRKQFDAYFGVS